MIKLVGLFKIKPGMSREDFVEYYETKHAPLILKLMPQIAEYRRNFILLDDLFIPGHIEGDTTLTPPFDVMTECWFADRNAYEEMRLVTENPEVGGRIARDEANFLDRDTMVMFLVDERTSVVARG